MLPTSPEYFFTYFGILRAGGIPVPIYPPARASQREDHVRRHTGILANAQAAFLVSVPEAMRVARLLQARVSGLREVLTPLELAAGGSTPLAVPVRGDDVAFIQYTSGSTDAPKGVALTHANLLANIRAMAQAIEAGPDDVFVSWLPLPAQAEEPFAAAVRLRDAAQSAIAVGSASDSTRAAPPCATSSSARQARAPRPRSGTTRAKRLG